MKIGFIGAGNMASAMFSGMQKSNIIDKNDVFVNSRTKGTLERIKKDYGYNVCIDVNDVVKQATDVLFICVKPQVVLDVANDIKDLITQNQLIVSIVAGKSISFLSEQFGTDKIIRIMPNTPCLVGAGISAVSYDKNIFDGNNDLQEKISKVLEIVNCMGEYEVVEEKYIDAITQVSGASPAWIFMMIEALADGGVACGMPRNMAYKFASNAVFGAGKLAKDKLDTMCPAMLKDMVCSPAGTTIEGVKILEEKGYRSALIDAVIAAYNRAKSL